MRKAHTLVLALFLMAGSCPAHEQQVPIRRILPEDIVQDSIQLIQVATNRFAVRWTYTEASANKMLAFEEAHAGETVRTQVGSFESTGAIAPFTSLPGCADYSEWGASWLKRRTDKVFGLNEKGAKMIEAGLKK